MVFFLLSFLLRSSYIYNLSYSFFNFCRVVLFHISFNLIVNFIYVLSHIYKTLLIQSNQQNHTCSGRHTCATFISTKTCVQINAYTQIIIFFLKENDYFDFLKHDTRFFFSFFKVFPPKLGNVNLIIFFKEYFL